MRLHCTRWFVLTVGVCAIPMTLFYVAGNATTPGQRGAGDHSNGGKGPDGFLASGPIMPGTNYTPAIGSMRGGFRYLNIFMLTEGTMYEYT